MSKQITLTAPDGRKQIARLENDLSTVTFDELKYQSIAPNTSDYRYSHGEIFYQLACETAWSEKVRQFDSTPENPFPAGWENG
jgi:hypothetical protein